MVSVVLRPEASLALACSCSQRTIRLLSALFFFTLTCFSTAPANALVILRYSEISQTAAGTESTPLNVFKEHLAMIEASGLKVVALEDVTKPLRRRKSPPDNAVLITFDGSHRSIHDTAYPLLKERGWPFVVFASVRAVGDGNQALTWEQLKAMTRNGAAIANNSMHHPHFVQRSPGMDMDTWRNLAKREVLTAEAKIRLTTGEDHKVLAFPFGEYDEQLLSVLKSIDFLGVSLAEGAVREEDSLAMPRFSMTGANADVTLFAAKLRALPLPLDKLQLRDQEGDRLNDLLLAAEVDRPILELKLEDSALADTLTCYLGNDAGPMSMTVDGRWVRIQSEQPIPMGKTHYHCTAKAASGDRSHWFTQPLLRSGTDGVYTPGA